MRYLEDLENLLFEVCQSMGSPQLDVPESSRLHQAPVVLSERIAIPYESLTWVPCYPQYPQYRSARASTRFDGLTMQAAGTSGTPHLSSTNLSALKVGARIKRLADALHLSTTAIEYARETLKKPLNYRVERIRAPRTTTKGSAIPSSQD